MILSAIEEIHTWQGRRKEEKSWQRQLRKEAGRIGWGQRSAERPSSAAPRAGGVSDAFVSFFSFFLPGPGSGQWQTAGISRKTWSPTAPSAEEVKAGAETGKCVCWATAVCTTEEVGRRQLGGGGWGAGKSGLA